MPRIAISPRSASIDDPVSIVVSDVEPGSRVRLRLRNHSLNAEAFAEFIVSSSGKVDVAQQAPVAGDYEGVDPSGLFWSAQFDPGSDVTSMVEVLAQLEPLAYTLSATAPDESVTTEHFSRLLLASNIDVATVREGQLRGTLFAPRGAADAPGVIVLGGSDGGNLWQFIAAFLAKYGYVALSLPYFAFEDLPGELVEIPLEYFGEGIRWLRDRPEVDPGRVGVLGMSRGGEAALLIGASFTDVAAVVALVPSGVTGGGIGADLSAMGRSAWTLDGAPFDVFPPPGDPVTFQEAQGAVTAGKPFAGAGAIIRALERAGDRINEVSIPVERTNGAIFMMSGEDDQLWASSRLAEVAERRLRSRSFPHPYEHHRYEDTGHFGCLLPNLPSTSSAGRHPVVPLSLAFGGTPKGNAAASADLWPRIVAFLHKHLQT